MVQKGRFTMWPNNVGITEQFAQETENLKNVTWYYWYHGAILKWLLKERMFYIFLSFYKLLQYLIRNYLERMANFFSLFAM